MNILGILGSARRGGNTEILIDIALEAAKEHGAAVSKVPLSEKAIAPCDGCGKCQKSGRCVVDDDMQEVYRQMREADGILWATPVYFWSMTGQTKIVMDRTYALTFPKLQLADKVGGLITVASIRGCMSTAHIFHTYFRYHAMFFAEAVTGFASAKGAIRESESAILSAQEMISQMVSMIQAGLKHPAAFDLPLHRYVKKKHGLP